MPPVIGGAADVVDRLRSRSDQYPLVLELRERPDFTSPLEKVKEVFDRLEEI